MALYSTKTPLLPKPLLPQEPLPNLQEFPNPELATLIKIKCMLIKRGGTEALGVRRSAEQHMLRVLVPKEVKLASTRAWWNALPLEIRALRELNKFCRACKAELFHQAWLRPGLYTIVQAGLLVYKAFIANMKYTYMLPQFLKFNGMAESTSKFMFYIVTRPELQGRAGWPRDYSGSPITAVEAN